MTTAAVLIMADGRKLPCRFAATVLPDGTVEDVRHIEFHDGRFSPNGERAWQPLRLAPGDTFALTVSAPAPVVAKRPDVVVDDSGDEWLEVERAAEALYVDEHPLGVWAHALEKTRGQYRTRIRTNLAANTASRS